MNWMEFVVAVLAGLASVIPLAIQLIKYVKQAVKEKNWAQVMNKVIDLMEVAETKFKEGAERKEWVMAMLKASADSINYDIDYDAVSEMIDTLCDMSKIINPAHEDMAKAEA